MICSRSLLAKYIKQLELKLHNKYVYLHDMAVSSKGVPSTQKKKRERKGYFPLDLHDRVLFLFLNKTQGCESKNLPL